MTNRLLCMWKRLETWFIEKIADMVSFIARKEQSKEKSRILDFSSKLCSWRSLRYFNWLQIILQRHLCKCQNCQPPQYQILMAKCLLLKLKENAIMKETFLGKELKLVFPGRIMLSKTVLNFFLLGRYMKMYWFNSEER